MKKLIGTISLVMLLSITLSSNTKITKDETKAVTVAFTIENEIEEELLLEDWMVNDTLFDARPISIDKETPLVIEKWMIDDSNFVY